MILLVFGSVLVALRNPIANGLFERGDEDLPISAPAVLSAAVAATGLMLVAQAVPRLAADLARPYIESTNIAGGLDAAERASERAYLLRGLVMPMTQLALGAVLCLRARTVATRLLREREPVVAAALPACPHCGAAYDPRDYDAHSAALCAKCGQPLDLSTQ